jgi:hypothetical protein
MGGSLKVMCHSGSVVCQMKHLTTASVYSSAGQSHQDMPHVSRHPQPLNFDFELWHCFEAGITVADAYG